MYLLPWLVLGLAVGLAAAQNGPEKLPPPPPVPGPAADGIVAKVNDQVISEREVQRIFHNQGIPPEREASARPKVIEFLIDKTLIDQYLAQMKIEPDKKDVDSRLEEIYALIKKDIDAKKENKKVEDILKEMMFTEAEFRTEVENELRWDRFVSQQASADKLQKFFESNRESFDGSQVRARHILLNPSSPDDKAVEAVIAKLKEYRKQVEEAANAAVAKLPANADEYTKKKTYNDTVDATFADLARKNSSCPSRMAGGDLDWFERANKMVEPFARAAFALQPYQMSDVVKSGFGYHLILVTDRRPGHEVKFEEVKPKVERIYGDRLHEAVLTAMRPRAKIDLTPAK
jgi:parvulin-like peptidyl-prolyl isomerase